MTLQLPAHLANRQSHNIAEKAVVGLGTAIPPHISIRGNTFTAVDAAGNEAPIGALLDIVVVDSAEQPAKRYYKNKWTPDSNEPPTCWSSNGIVPNAAATERQARTCVECAQNERGSAVSAMSGVAIKACRDEKWLAVLLPQWPQMLFQLVVTPGSFKNWQGFAKNFGNGVDISDVITRVSFQPQVNGVLVFEILGYAQNNPQYITQDILIVLEAAWAENKTDALVGRSGQPALPAPERQPQNYVVAEGPNPVPFSPTVQPVPAAVTGFVLAPVNTSVPTATATSTAEQPTQRRRRRTAAEMAQANAPTPQGQTGFASAPAQQPAPFAPQAQPAPFMPATAPAQPAAAPAAPQGNGAQFGIQSGAAPNSDITAMLQGVFGKK